MEIDELAKFASEASDKMKNLELVTSDADAIVEQLHDYKVRCLYGEYTTTWTNISQTVDHWQSEFFPFYFY